jgi:hypothetical protein
MHQQEKGRLYHERDRCEVFHRIVAEVRVDRRCDREAAGGCEQRVTVRRRGGDCSVGHHASCARPVLDDKRASERFGEFLCEEPRLNVVAAAGRLAYYDADRLRRIIRRR